MRGQTTTGHRIKQLDLFQLQQEFPKEIVINQDKDSAYDDIDLSKNVLICNVKKDNMEHFLDGTAKLYYSGKRLEPLIVPSFNNKASF